MSPALIIARKRDGHRLSREEIRSFITGLADGSWADYQATALLMAIFLKGMTSEETADLTLEMLASGAKANLSSIPLKKVDKHSTGGVGDKVSLILAPLVAACGVAVPMISGRGLGHTGGTLDKLESIPGFTVGLGLARFEELTAKHGFCMIGQTAEIVPADRKLYSLRDVTATVESIPLICASILSKKFAEDIDALVLDVKFGRGAFMQDIESARQLAEALVAIGRSTGKDVRALLTSMEQPLGCAVGNAVEVAESIETLKGCGPGDLLEVTIALGVEMLLAAGAAENAGAATKKLYRALATGEALEKFRGIIEAQGGDPKVIDAPARLPTAPLQIPYVAVKTAHIASVDPRRIALALLDIGAGRKRAEDSIDPAVGLTHLAKVGQHIRAGETLAVIHARDEAQVTHVRAALDSSFTYSETAVTVPALVLRD